MVYGMSIRLFLKEAQKLFTQKKFCLFAIGLLCIQSLYLGSSIITSKEEQIVYHKEYQMMYEQVLQLDPAQREEHMVATIEELSGFLNIYYQQMDPTNVQFDLQVLHAYEQHQENCTIPIGVEVSLWNKAYTNYQAIQTYPDYIENIKVRTEELKLAPMWKHYSEQKQQEIMQTYERYAPLASMQPTWSDTSSIEVLLHFDAFDWFIVLFILVLGIHLFYVDEQGEMNHLMLAYPNGRKQTMIAKLLVGTMLLMLFTLIAFLLNVWIVSELLGGIDLNIMMQSIPLYRESPYVLSIQELLSVIYSIKSLVFSMVLILFLGIYQMLKNRNIAILSTIALLVGGYVLYQTIGTQSAFVYARYINVYTWMQAWSMFTNYVNVSFLTMNISLLSICMIGIVMLIGIGVSINLIFYQQIIHRKKRKPSLLLIRMKDRVFATTSVCFHEFYHCFLMKKVWVFVLLIIAFFAYQMIGIANSWSSVQFYNKEINTMYKQRGGLLDDRKIAWLQEQNSVYEKAEAQHLENLQQVQSNTITIEAYRSYLREYYEGHSERGHAQQLYTQYARDPNNPYLINPLPYRNIFGFVSNQNEYMITAFVMVVMIFMMSGIFANDQEHKEHHLYELCPQGRRKRYAIKVGYGVGLAFIIAMTMFLTRWLLYAPIGFDGIGGAPIMDIVGSTDILHGFMQSPWLASLTLSQYTMMVILVQSLGIVTMSLLILCFSKLCKHRIYATLIACIVFFLPFLFYLAGYPFVEYFTIFDLISGTIFLKDVHMYPKVIGCIVLSVVACYYLYQTSSETTTIIK